ncbi:hypothetical protein NECAME_01402 [Necator americanus]|uniref:Uncharacterized protein n=1 Tax=Necator americanus TaxID=51031 RepID=W2TUK6_NECAM|nr:hypothetical protein NECAME_01402 [Necator americanus]ETN85513.1 hypothetical protein NECAME_01402 [Necator americanus]
MSGEGSDSESAVRDVPCDHSSSCTPSTSGASSPAYSIPRRRKGKMRRKLSRSRYLLAIEDRNRLRKLAGGFVVAQKIRIASNTVSAITFLRWKEKIDRRFEKQFEEKRSSLRRLQQENEVLRAHQRTFADGVSFSLNFPKKGTADCIYTDIYKLHTILRDVGVRVVHYSFPAKMSSTNSTQLVDEVTFCIPASL